LTVFLIAPSGVLSGIETGANIFARFSMYIIS
jgi:hypothetical protein